MAILTTIKLDVFTKLNALILISCIVFATLAGPFETADMDLLPRASFWCLALTFALVVAITVQAILRDVLLKGVPQLGRDIAGTFLFSGIYAGFLVGLTKLYVESNSDSQPAPSFVVLFAATVLCTACVIAIRTAVLTPELPKAPQSPPQPCQPRLMRRLPSDAKGPILRLWVEDHFVNVVTPEKTYRLRMRLSDAVEEMEGIDGLAPHRSHWIARHAIAEMGRRNGKTFLQCLDGEIIPVSRGFTDPRSKYRD